MSRLIDELKKEHLIIVDVLDHVSRLGVNSKEGQQRLIDAKNGLLAHLRKEDEQLYPALNRAAEKDARLKQTLDLFAKDMTEISKGAMDFFGKYSKGGSGLDFARDVGKLFIVLKSRISKEEDIIYKEYEKINP